MSNPPSERPSLKLHIPISTSQRPPQLIKHLPAIRKQHRRDRRPCLPCLVKQLPCDVKETGKRCLRCQRSREPFCITSTYYYDAKQMRHVQAFSDNAEDQTSRIERRDEVQAVGEDLIERMRSARDHKNWVLPLEGVQLRRKRHKRLETRVDCLEPEEEDKEHDFLELSW